MLIECNTAQRAAVDLVVGAEVCRSCVDTAGKGDLCNIQLILEQIIDNLNHALYGHRLLGDHPTAFRVSGCPLGLERRALHLVLWCTVADALLLVYLEHRQQQRIVLAQDQCMVKILEHFPSGLLNLVTRENHIYAGLYRIFYLNGQNAGMSVEILGFSLESVKSVGVLQIQSCDTSHGIVLLIVILSRNPCGRSEVLDSLRAFFSTLIINIIFDNNIPELFPFVNRFLRIFLIYSLRIKILCFMRQICHNRA